MTNNTANTKSNHLYLIDGSSYLYRAYHALPPLTNSHGEPTGAVFGVANMIRKLTLEHKPEYIAVIFDAKGKNFRHELYKEYKAHRPPMPDDLKVQIKPLHKLIKAMGLPLISIEGVEADDVIASLTKQAESQNWQVTISTIDKDIMQLVNSTTKIINDMTKTEFDEKAVEQKFGVPSSLIVDYLALVGDKADNVPGIPGVGPKTAAKWLNEYGCLDSVIKNASNIKNKAGKNLQDNLDLLPLSRELVQLKTDVQLPSEYTLENLKKKITNKEQLVTLLEALNFKSWLNDELKNKSNNNSNSNYLDSKDTNISNTNKNRYIIVNNKNKFEELINNLNKSKYFSFDTETTSLNHMHAELVGLSFACGNSSNDITAYYIPINHVDADSNKIKEQLNLDFVINKITNIFNNKNIIKIAQNLKYDLNILKKYNINIASPIADTMLLSYVYNSVSNRHNLDDLAEKYLNHSNIKYEDIAGKGAKQICFSQVDIDKAGNYACEDADITLQLYVLFNNYLNQSENKKLLNIYNTIEIPLIPILAKMEHKGILLNTEILSKQSKELEKKLEDLSNNIYKTADSVFNIDSTKQLQEILYNNLKLPILQKTPKGQPSTAESVLQDLSLDYPIAKDILDYRSLRKLKSTYTDKLPQQIDQKTKRIHTSFHQAVTSTGRLSSSDPNLQNIPIRTEEGRKIRKAFIADKNFVLISSDYSQVELRIMAHLSQDESLLAAFKNDKDIHSHTASEIFNIDIKDVSSEHRRHAKAINFGLIYGMSAFGLAKQLGIDRHSAQEYIDLYFARYPGVKSYMNNIKKFAEKHGYVETLFGRRLYLPDIRSSNFQRRTAAERLAINAPMQGTAADIIKKAMILVDEQFNKHELINKAYLILQVHDELIIECHADYIIQVQDLIINSMQDAAKLSVPLKVSCNIGQNWDEAH